VAGSCGHEHKLTSRDGTPPAALPLFTMQFGWSRRCRTERGHVSEASPCPGITHSTRAHAYYGGASEKRITGRLIAPHRDRLDPCDPSRIYRGSTRENILKDLDFYRASGWRWIRSIPLFATDSTTTTPLRETFGTLGRMKQGPDPLCRCVELAGWQVMKSGWSRS